LFRWLALAALVGWPIIPIFFIQVHLRPAFWRRLGALTYLAVLLEWVPVIALVTLFQNFFLMAEFQFGALSLLGAVLLLLGLGLQVWAFEALGWRGLLGYWELKPQSVSQKLVIRGPFRLVRHPAYLSHTFMFVGIFLATGFLGTGILALLDFVTSYFAITRLEENELITRFGKEFEDYRASIPKFLPALRRNRTKSM
jgi:protein-S-isoprenylcysteine O-methyltransferase Ste14